MNLPDRGSSYPTAVPLALAALTGVLLAACGPPDREYPSELVYLDQGWTDADRQIFYYTPQGTQISELQYLWFTSLEKPLSRELISSPTNLTRFGFLYDPEQLVPDYQPPPYNPGNLPVGFTAHEDSVTGKAVLDVTCAACHTAQLEYEGRAIRIDGGPALHSFASLLVYGPYGVVAPDPGQFLPSIVFSMLATYSQPFKFDRFAKRVLGLRYPQGKEDLREELKQSLDLLTVLTFHIWKGGLSPVAEGYGRIDALTHIAQTVFGTDLDPRNFRQGTGPVSYPHIWDIWKFDWVQWNGSAGQAMARNIGESLVLARLDLVDDAGNALPPEDMYRSSVLLPELDCIETTLWRLQAPIWDERYLPAIDQTKVAAGRTLFEANCAKCHGPYYYTSREEQATPYKPVEWKMTIVDQDEIGTDPNVGANFVDYRYDASALDPGNPALKDIAGGKALEYVTAKVAERKYRLMGASAATQWEMNGWGRGIETRANRGYKARPLQGIWATSPFLHNGSVPNLYEMLVPEEERSDSFYVGTHEFDPINVGYVHTDSVGTFLFDTSISGNYNTGHQFRDDDGAPGRIGRLLTEDERMEIIEFLKVNGSEPGDYTWRIEDPRPSPEPSGSGSPPLDYPILPLTPPSCSTALEGPARYRTAIGYQGPWAEARSRTADTLTANSWARQAEIMMSVASTPADSAEARQAQAWAQAQYDGSWRTPGGER